MLTRELWPHKCLYFLLSHMYAWNRWDLLLTFHSTQLKGSTGKKLHLSERYMMNLTMWSWKTLDHLRNIQIWWKWSHFWQKTERKNTFWATSLVIVKICQQICSKNYWRSVQKIFQNICQKICQNLQLKGPPLLVQFLAIFSIFFTNVWYC